MSHGLRASRLDPVQHKAVHGLNAATELCAKLPRADQLRIQRLVLENASAGILTISEVAEIIGSTRVRGTSSNGGAKGPLDATQALSLDGPEVMAKFLCFARVAWLCEEALVVDLGEDTRKAHLIALKRRFKSDRFPVHATNICACTECHRVANAHSVDAGINVVAPRMQSFNELGVSCSMLSTENEHHLRCAKRSSASLKTAVSFEAEMEKRRVEDEEVDVDSIQRMFRDQQSADSGIAARIRRDAKNSFEQRSTAVACGEEPLLIIPIVGRAVRLWGEWYSLCTICGCMLRVYPNNRFRGSICCGRCDAELLGVEPAVEEKMQLTVCRFCGKCDPKRTGSRWKAVKSPRDEGPANIPLPPPLRVCYYCPQHYRSWLGAAHRAMSTRVILSHLAMGAKPVFGAEQSAATEDRPDFEADGLLGNAPPQRKRRRRGRASSAAANVAGDE